MNQKKQIVVWDKFVRVFHWSLVLLVFLAYMTADLKGPLHKYIGFGVLGLVVIRIFWGFSGTKYALFSNFVCSPVKALNYLKELATGKTTRYIGHNPAAAWMILLLLSSSTIICLTGYAAHTTKKGMNSIGFDNTISIVKNAYANEEKEERHGGKHKGRERQNDGKRGDSESDSIWSDIHEVSAQFMLILFCLHIVGVAVSSSVHSENLVSAMITGKKDIKD